MKAQTIDLKFFRQLAELVLISAILVMIPNMVHAAAVDSGLGLTICAIADNFLGAAGKGIATIGISTIGIIACLGRITWTQALIAGTGVAVLFGAPAIVASIGNTGVCP